VAHRLGCRAREPLSVCVATWQDSRRARFAAHSHADEQNYIIWRAAKRAQIRAVKEPIGLLRRDGKRPDGATLIPGTKGNRWHGMSQFRIPLLSLDLSFTATDK